MSLCCSSALYKELETNLLISVERRELPNTYKFQFVWLMQDRHQGNARGSDSNGRDNVRRKHNVSLLFRYWRASKSHVTTVFVKYYLVKCTTCRRIFSVTFMLSSTQPRLEQSLFNLPSERLSFLYVSCKDNLIRPWHCPLIHFQEVQICLYCHYGFVFSS